MEEKWMPNDHTNEKQIMSIFILNWED